MAPIPSRCVATLAQAGRYGQHSMRLAAALAVTVITIVLQYGIPHGLGQYDAVLFGVLSARVLVMWLLATSAGIVFGWPLLRSAVSAAWFFRTMTMDTLVSISSGVAYLYATSLVLTSWAGASVQGGSSGCPFHCALKFYYL